LQIRYMIYNAVTVFDVSLLRVGEVDRSGWCDRVGHLALALSRLALASFAAAAAAHATVGFVDRDGDVGEHCESKAVKERCACEVRWVVCDWRETIVVRLFYISLGRPDTCGAQGKCFRNASALGRSTCCWLL